MAHYALINDNNVVQRVLFVDNAHILDEYGNEDHEIGISMCKEGLGDPDARLVRTSINRNIRFRYAAVGYTYNKTLDAFIPPKPYASWVLNNETCDWEAPIPQPEPEEGFEYVWNEEELAWDKIEVPPVPEETPE